VSFSSLSSSSSSSAYQPTTGEIVICLISGILAPLVLALGNLVDKIAVENRVWNTYAYTAIIGLWEILIGGIEMAASSWDNFNEENKLMIIWPFLGGVVDGVFIYLYFILLGLADASVVVGVMYMYPSVVCVLSYFVLDEKLGVGGYVGVVVLLIGAIVLSINGIARIISKCKPKASILDGIKFEEENLEQAKEKEKQLAEERLKKPIICWYPTPHRVANCFCRCRDCDAESDDDSGKEISDEDSLYDAKRRKKQSGCCGCCNKSVDDESIERTSESEMSDMASRASMDSAVDDISRDIGGDDDGIRRSSSVTEDTDSVASNPKRKKKNKKRKPPPSFDDTSVIPKKEKHKKEKKKKNEDEDENNEGDEDKNEEDSENKKKKKTSKHKKANNDDNDDGNDGDNEDNEDNEDDKVGEDDDKEGENESGKKEDGDANKSSPKKLEEGEHHHHHNSHSHSHHKSRSNSRKHHSSSSRRHSSSNHHHSSSHHHHSSSKDDSKDRLDDTRNSTDEHEENDEGRRKPRSEVPVGGYNKEKSDEANGEETKRSQSRDSSAGEDGNVKRRRSQSLGRLRERARSFSESVIRAEQKVEKLFFGCLTPGKLFAILAVPMFVTVGGYEFLIALGAKKGMTTFQVSGVEIFVQGVIVTLGAWLTKDGRRNFPHEITWNWMFAFLNAFLTVCSQLLTVYSLTALPAAVSSSLCAIQPLGVLILETIAGVSAFKVSQCFAFKFPPIVFIIAGVTLLSVDVLLV